MIGKFAQDSYIDVDAIQFITGDYNSKLHTQWTTNLIVHGVSLSIEGQPGKNIMDAFEWRWKHSITDMVPDSPTYRKTTK
jgi:hypothetical protein